MKRETFLKKKRKILRRDNRFQQNSYRVYFVKSNKHFYASLIDNDTGNVLLSVASSAVVKTGSSKERVSALAKSFSEKVSAHDCAKLFFDRGVYQYHGLVKQFVEQIREHGVKV